MAWRATKLLETLAIEVEDTRLQVLTNQLADLGSQNRPDLANIGVQLVERWKAEQSQKASARLSELGASVQAVQNYVPNQQPSEVTDPSEQAAEKIDIASQTEKLEAQYQDLESQLAEAKRTIEESRLPYLGPDGVVEASRTAESGAFDIRRRPLDPSPAQVIEPQIMGGDGFADIIKTFEGGGGLEVFIEDGGGFGGGMAVDDERLIREFIVDDGVIMGGGLGGGFVVGGGGGFVIEGGDFVGGIGFNQAVTMVKQVYITIPARWQGTPEDFKLLRNIDRISVIEIAGLDITKELLTELAMLPELTNLTLTETEFDTEWVKAFHRLKPNVNLTLTGPAFLGVTAQLSGGDTGGCRVTNVINGSAAGEAGIELNDVIVRVDDQPINDFVDLTLSVASKGVGDQVEVEVLRGTQKRVFFANLKDRTDVKP